MKVHFGGLSLGPRGLRAAVLVVLIGGCGVPRGDVSGEVKFNGKPLPWGRITFLPEKGPPFAGVITEGAYSVAGIPVGPSMVAVESFKTYSTKKSYAGMPEPTKAEIEEAKKQRAKLVHDIPSHYGRPETSQLVYTVTPGEQVHHIDLTP